MSITTPATSKGTNTGFLSFNSHPPRIWLTAPNPHPPESTLLAWQAEGFHTSYLPFDASTATSYVHTLKQLGSELALGETYALVAYGEAATAVLKTAQKPLNKCCAIVAFYPTVLPAGKHAFPSLLDVQIHVAGSQASPRREQCAWGLYRYERCGVGFAERENEKAYSPVEAELAWSRTLACLRRGFKQDVDIEGVVQTAFEAKYEDAGRTPEQASLALMGCVSQNSAHVTVVPTLEGGVGRRRLNEFYREFFIPSLVEDFEVRLVSRTVGVDRVVDEMVVSFTHTDDVDWMLPGVPPTDKRVEVAVVSVVGVKGGKLYSEHMYWDQASVLVQVGLLDPKLVPKSMKSEGLKRLPAVGAEGARQVVEAKPERYNGLLREHGLMDGLPNGVNGS